MATLFNQRYVFGAVLALLIMVSAGCVKRPAVIYDRPEASSTGYYEKAWIDPRIILSDSLYTLIRADRVDSFYVDEPLDSQQEVAPAIEFQVREESCFTTVSLLDDRSQMIRLLVARNLAKGFYKVTCNVSRLSPELSSVGVYYLRAEYCGFPVVERVTIQ